MSATAPLEIGIVTFGEPTRNAGGKPMDAGARTRDILEWARVADEAGLDVLVRYCWPDRQRRPSESA